MSHTLLYESDKSMLYYREPDGPGDAVIIKVLKNKIPDQQDVIRFNNEFEVTRGIQADSIRRVYDNEPFNNLHALTLEYINGETLGEHFLRHKRTLQEFLSMAIKAAEALHTLHASGIVHKDINKNNILIDKKTGNIKIIDFGIAAKIDVRVQHVGNPKRLEGTLEYISPEQTGRLNRVVDHRTDLYSFGATLYELICGHPPFRSENAIELVHAHIAKAPEPLTSYRIQFSEAEENVPDWLSAIVIKLLAKNAEDRYQSAYGLTRDLHLALDKLNQNLSFKDFEPGQFDVSEKFQISPHLYGREKEIQTLVNAFENAIEAGYNSRDFVLISGYSGTGKSSLVEELHEPVARRQGYFLKGKYDQLARHIPFSGISHALNSFVDSVLTEDEATLNIWKEKILNELEGQARTLFELIPHLNLLTGPQPEIAALTGADAQVRLSYMLQKFIRAISSVEHPVVLFIDDLQWADLASFDLLRDLVTNNELSGFLLTGAYRDNEVDTAHPLMLTLQDIRLANVKIHSVQITNLSGSDIRQLVADTLNHSEDEAAELASQLLKKTKGNAFFVTQCLKAMYEEKIIAFDAASRKWIWHKDKMARLDLSENVVDLLKNKISLLEPETQEILKIAACIGNTFDLGLLAVVAKRDEKEVAQDLWPAVHEGLISPSGVGIFYSVDTVLHNSPLNKKKFRFIHDKIQHAVYDIIPDAERKRYHLETGRILLKSLPEPQLEERLFDIVHQLNTGAQFIESENEKLQLAALNGKAGMRAKSSGAFKTSSELLQKGICLLPETSWKKHYNLTLSLHTEAIENDFLLGKLTEMQTRSEEVLKHTEYALDRVRIFYCLIQASIAQNKFPETIAYGLDILSQLGVDFPKNPKGYHIGGALLKTKIQLGGKKIEDLMNLPEMTEKEKIEAMRILQCMIPAAFMSGSNLFPLIVFKLVSLSVKHGNTPVSAFGYACYAIASVGVLGELNSGYRFGQLSLKLAERYQNDAIKAQVAFVFNCFIRHWKEPLKDTAPFLLEAYKLGIKGGAFVDGVWAACYRIIWMMQSGSPLSQVIKTQSDFSEVFRQRDAGAFLISKLLRQTAENLQSEDYEACHILKGKFYDEDELVPVHKSASDKSAVCIYFLHKIELCYLFGKYAEAQSTLNDFKKYSEAVTGLAFVPIFNFYESLVAIALTKQDCSSSTLVKRTLKNQRKMKRWSQHSPYNYAHKFSLVQAELAALAGEELKARALYDEAIDLAGRNGFTHEQAIACELAARFCIQRKNNFLAEIYLQRAVELYLIWGAPAKRKMLLEEFPNLLAAATRHKEITRTENRKGVTTTTTRVVDLDLASLMKASTSISGEIVLDKLLEKLISIVIENAGAQHGMLLLKRENALFIEAEKRVEDEDGKIRRSIPASPTRLPMSLVNYVQRTLEFVVVDDAGENTNFAQDAYIIRNKPKSILCAPVVDKGKFVGVIYLENNITTHAFSEDRVEILKLLSGQIAVSIDNAMLYENLEQKVAERTAEITQQKQVIEHQNNELVSSIRYARRIQGAVLPNEEILHSEFKESYIIYRPKDIVSGDFYWFAQRDNKFIVAVADCTGHGVPGAFMSMIGSALLNEVVIKNEIYEPAEILTQLHNGIVKSLGQGQDGGSRDGMDISLLVWDKSSRRLLYAGANNPVYRIRNKQLEVFSANKRPIGYFVSDPPPFTQTEIETQTGDLFCLFSDGFADQFGGPRDKKYSYKRLKTQLVANCEQPLDEQKKLLLEDFKEWKGQTPQIDDVCLLSFKV